jgi:hypothetical protein
VVWAWGPAVPSAQLQLQLQLQFICGWWLLVSEKHEPDGKHESRKKWGQVGINTLHVAYG